MLKIKTFIILIIVYIISFLAIKSDINIFYPYYLVKDIIFFPVKAIDKEVDLSSEVQDGIKIEQEMEREELLKLNDLSSSLTDFDIVHALVIERNRMYWFNTITLNKGSNKGIKEDMAVITGDGLIGKVTRVSKTTSEVKLLTTNDINNKISVMIKNGNDTIYGIMSGYDSSENTLEVTGTNKVVEVLNDSLVYTSGMGGIFPSGILIGKVVSTENDKYDVSKIIKVEPSSNFNDFRFVNVLIRK